MIYFLTFSRIDLSDCYIAYDQTSYDCMTGSQDFHYNLEKLIPARFSKVHIDPEFQDLANLT